MDLITPCLNISFAVTFYLVTNIRNVPNVTTFNSTNVTDVNFNPSNQYVFLCHGWQDNGGDDNFYKNATEVLLAGGFAVIQVVYYDAVACRIYTRAIIHLPAVAEHVAIVISNMKSKNVSLSYITIAGISLGAQTAAMVGGRVIATNNGAKIGNIVGLDPPRHGFAENSTFRQLSIDDATYVAVYHTSCTYGRPKPIGHLDLYMNGGLTQGKCLTGFEANDHTVARNFFVQIVANPAKFKGCRCNLNENNQIAIEKCASTDHRECVSNGRNALPFNCVSITFNDNTIKGMFRVDGCPNLP